MRKLVRVLLCFAALPGPSEAQAPPGAGVLSSVSSPAPSAPPSSPAPSQEPGARGHPSTASPTPTSIATPVAPWLPRVLFLVSWIASLVGYVSLKKKTGRWLWFLSMHKYDQPSPTILRGALTLAAFAVASSISVHWLVSVGLTTNQQADYLLTPGTVFAFFALTMTLAGFLNTLVVRERQSATFVGFPGLSERLYELYRELEHRLRDDEHHPRADAPPENVYMVDYSVRPGDISDSDAAKSFRDYLGSIAAHNCCHLHIAVFAEEELAAYYGTLLGERPDNPKVVARVEKATSSLTTLASQERVTAWRSSKILAEHYVVSSRMAIMYSVVRTMEGNGKANLVQGEVTWDAGRVDFLRQTALAYLRHAVTPSWRREGLVWATDQPGVERVEIIAGDDRDELSEERPASWEQAAAITHDAKGNEIKATGKVSAAETYPLPTQVVGKFAKVRLVKVGGTEYSPPSWIQCRPQ